MKVEVGRALPTVDHAYTHLKVTLHPYLCRFVSMRPQVGEGQPFRWVAVEELEHYAMPRANRKVIEALKTLNQ
jgi:A/G-specific adenine glycosylase